MRAPLLAGVVVVGALFGCASATTPITEQLTNVEWLPLLGPPGQRRVEVLVLLDGWPTRAILDTGAMTSTISQALASRFGLSPAEENTVGIIDAHGAVTHARTAVLDSVALGRQWIDDVDVVVVPGAQEVVLIGYDVLRHFDLVLAHDEGVVGLLPPGTAPTTGTAIPVRLDSTGRALHVDVEVQGKADRARSTLVVDTGAEATSFPSAPAMLAGVEVDRRFRSTTVGVASTKEEPGRYALRPLRASGIELGNVLAWEGLADDGTSGLLGNDVLLNHRTTIVSADAPGGPKLLLVPLSTLSSTLSCREHAQARVGDDVDDGACLQVRVVRAEGADLERLRFNRAWNNGGTEALLGEAVDSLPQRRPQRDDVCLEVKLHHTMARKRVQFVVGDAWGGAFVATMAMVVQADPRRDSRFCVGLPDSTRLLGIDATTPLFVRSLRVDDAVDPKLCTDADVCSWYHGP
jgi:predicted aspartyl protease